MNRFVMPYGILCFPAFFLTGFGIFPEETFLPELTQAKAEAGTHTSQAESALPCEPTPSDALGPFYEPNAPERVTVGKGHVLSGVVRSSKDCSPLEGVRIELWLAGPDGKYNDNYRATMFSKKTGEYKFESHFPPPYSGRPSHIHIKVEAKGYHPLITQFYPLQGQLESKFDLVLIPVNL
ncbi:MAG: Catechol 1,2-dioxygenase 1 [Candidatus Jettenia ecosi]|uniref:Catechol 1,2-dioxygenase 1 n=1 Tax=Candidatus Jettenia ecosi TaxID=2494326 RepID=A0A533QEH2_9BACT|nr:MAG: Catechol 1,2-dioxygenase 1 [Candidatus Jettenia ecosi]